MVARPVRGAAAALAAAGALAAGFLLLAVTSGLPTARADRPFVFEDVDPADEGEYRLCADR